MAEEDLRKVRAFAFGHQCLLYRDNSETVRRRKLVVSESAHLMPNQN